MRWTRWAGIGVAAAAVLVLASGCSDPEPLNYSLTVTSIDEAQVCGEGSERDELCFERDLLDLPDGIELRIDDCIGVDVDPPGSDQVVHGWWDGRCAARAVTLGVTRRDGTPVVLIPECLGSLTSLNIEDEAGERVWSVYRETSPEHPLLTHVGLGEIPPGFAEGDPLEEPPADATLTVSANQQLDLPEGTTTFSVDALEDELVVAGDETFATTDEYLVAAGCAPD